MIGHNFFGLIIQYILSYVKTIYVGRLVMARIIDGEKMNLIGENVKKYRKNHKLSQQELSNRLELLGVYICRGSVSRIEDGSRTVTDIELLALSKVLNVEIKDLYNKESTEF